MWVEAGQSPPLFWRSTFREIAVILDACAERDRRAHNDRAWLAWHIAALPQMKRLPKLEKLMLRGRPARRRAQTMDEQIAVMRQWQAVSR